MQRFIGLRPLFAGLFALFCTLPSGYAQLSKHGLIWHFGYRAGLDFTSGTPVKILNSAMDSYEGCASYCDANGKLLFYSNVGGFVDNPANGPRSGYIWNRNNAVMYDMGQTEGGGYSAAQGVVVVPKPSSPGRYYQFMVDHNASVAVPPLGVHRGLSYYEVDMSLNGGLGDVVGASVPVFQPAVECLSAVPKTNSQDFWIITVNYDSQDFVVVPVTASGVGQAQMRPRNNQSGEANVSVIKVSPDGRFLCAGRELYAFNAADATLQFLRTLDISTYSFSFSPNSQYLYGFDSDNAVVDMVQYDLLAANVPKLVVSATPIFTFGGLMQLGPDGNIYLIEQLEEDLLELDAPMSLSLIRCPNSTTPQFERATMKFPTDPANGSVYTSLPNFADYIFASGLATQDTVVRDICLNTISLQAPQPGLHYQWSTGDTTAQINVSAPGTYSVAVEDECGAAMTTVFQVRPGGVEVNITANAISDSCHAFPLTLQAVSSQTGTFQWSNGSTADSLVINNYGTYIVNFLTACGPATDTFRLLKPQQDCCRPLFPNAFTPNGDNINDRFSPIFDQCDIEFADFFIYDRWGELVFQSYNPAEQWDGLTLNGTLSQPDVYTYTLLYKRRDQSQEQFEKGQVTLLR